jgi:membrane-bound inhibitor of C-type lysozyme
MRFPVVTVVLALSVLCFACSREEAKPPAATTPAAPAEPAPAAAPAPPTEAAAPPTEAAAPVVSAADGHDYTCDDGFAFNARIDKGDAVVTYEGTSKTLKPAEGSSGAHFAGEGVTFIAQGNEAMLLRDGEKVRHCTAK